MNKLLIILELIINLARIVTLLRHVVFGLSVHDIVRARRVRDWWPGECAPDWICMIAGASHGKLDSVRYAIWNNVKVKI